MNIQFLGASGEVTGSCYVLETSRARVMVDCGLFQGGPGAEIRNRRPLAGLAPTLDAVVLTHAHLDHSGRLPVLARSGLRARVWCTPTTVQLADILLRDAAHLQAADLERCLRYRAQRGGQTAGACSLPLFNDADVTELLRRLAQLDYDRWQEIAPGVRIRFVDAGHILGSASVEVEAQDRPSSPARRIVFSGDVGERGSAVLRDPTGIDAADYVVMESTYGDRDHKPLDQTLDELHEVLADAAQGRGKVIIPVFAIGRTQTLIYHLGQMFRSGRLPRVPVYVDSPMAVRATRLYEQHRELFDDEARDLLRRGINPLSFPGLHLVTTGDESRALNGVSGPAVIMAPAGMCTGGRVLHHLRHRLGEKSTRVIIAGFQAEGTLGRRLVERHPRVRIFGEEIEVKASVHTMGGFSAHAGCTNLLSWAGAWAGAIRAGGTNGDTTTGQAHRGKSAASGRRAPRPHVFLTHGENAPRAALAGLLKDHHGIDAALPALGQRFALD